MDSSLATSLCTALVVKHENMHPYLLIRFLPLLIKNDENSQHLTRKGACLLVTYKLEDQPFNYLPALHLLHFMH